MQLIENRSVDPMKMAQSSSLVFRRRESVQRIGKPTKGITLRIAFTVIASIALILVLYIQYRILKSFDSQSQNVWNILNQNKKKSLDQRHHSKDPATHGQDPRRSLTLTAYLEPPSTLTYTKTNSRRPWFARNTTAAALKVIEFPRRQICDRTRILPDLPIDDFPTDDPFLPWLHDYFVSEDGRHIRFVAQNKRRCDTGDQHSHTMAFWEPQVTLFQSIPVVTEPNDKEKFRFATSLEEATHPATRFQCRFFHPATNQTMTTLSLYKFDYEYITWRKLRRPMIDRKGKDATMFWLSTLLFSCPIPEPWQHRIMRSSMTPFPNLYLDLVPIRTPIRTDLVLLTINHTGPDEYTGLQRRLFPLDKVFGQQHIIPPIEDAGRWANLPICPRPEEERMRLPDTSQAIEHMKPSNPKRRFRFVACTWTAASYTRRGDEVQVSDSASRLREWILFHLMVGVEHVYIYDNTNIDNTTTTPSDLWHVAQEFPKNQVTYHSWPCKICNNNRPAHSNPGERSSQYAAEASCRERYGPLTEWMTFIDVDEYLVPMKAMGDNNKPYDWRPILDEMKAKQVPILQFLSSRARPRVDMME